MKKYFIFVAVATFALLSCQKEELNSIVNDEVKKSEPLTLTASVEGFGTRATMEGNDNSFVWTTGDKIGIYVSDWEAKNQPFHVDEGGSSSAKFIYDYDGGVFNATTATAAFFPWQGTGSDKNNVYSGIMYFKLPRSYDGYTSGQMLTPLVAPVVYENNAYNPISFKHAGAAVKVTINNLPAGAHSIGMTVDGQQVYGNYRIDPANAGNDAMAVVDADNSQNTVWLNYTNDSEAKWDFIFPVPTITKPTLSFEIYDKNDILVWSKTTPQQASDLGRAKVLVMPAKDITPYSQFNAWSNEWGVCGTHTGWGIGDPVLPDTKMITDGKLCIAKEVSLIANAEFKVRRNNAWGTDEVDNFNASHLNSSKSNNASNNNGNIKVSDAGIYDIIFNSSDEKYGDYEAHQIRVVLSNCPYPTINQ